MTRFTAHAVERERMEAELGTLYQERERREQLRELTALYQERERRQSVPSEDIRLIQQRRYREDGERIAAINARQAALREIHVDYHGDLAGQMFGPMNWKGR